MPYLVRFLLGHAVIGFGVALATVAMIVVFDVAGLGTLIFESESGLLAVSLLTFFMGLTFGSVQMGFAVMRRGDSGGKGGKSARTRAPCLRLAVPVRAEQRPVCSPDRHFASGL